MGSTELVAARGAGLAATAGHALVDRAAELDAEMRELQIRVGVVAHMLEAQRTADAVIHGVDPTIFDGFGSGPRR